MIDLSLCALRASGAVPHWFGLGFIQLRLNERQRMQFWHPAFLGTAEGEVHSHPFSFCSQVVVGELTHETWRFEPDEDGDARRTPAPCCGGCAGAAMPATTGKLTLSGRYTLAAGSKFFFTAADFHRMVSRRAVALLCRGLTEDRPACVVRPINQDPPYRPCAPKGTAECWDIIEDLLAPIALRA